MDNLFLVKLALSFVIGGSYIAFTIWVSEKFGSRLGGLFIGLPSTILVSLIFIAWTQNTDAAVQSTPVVPAAIAACSLFVVAFIYALRFGRLAAILSATTVWFMLSLPLAMFSLNNIFISVALGLAFVGLSIFILRKFPHRKLERFHLSKRELLFRVMFSGSFVAIAVLFGKMLGPLWGGVFASYPAAFSSSLLLLEGKHGTDFASSVAKTMPYGSLTNIVFATAFFFVVPVIGMVSGTIAVYLLTVLCAAAVNKLVFKNEEEIISPPPKLP